MMTGNTQFDSFLFGIISAVSLPLGALLALIWIPKKKISAALMAFGAGALLAALAIDLVAETVKKGEFYPLAAGCIIGGIVYEIMNSLLNSQGGYLRKKSTAIRFIRNKKLLLLNSLFGKLSHVKFFHFLPHDEIHEIAHYIIRKEFKKGETIAQQGEINDELIIIENGKIIMFDELAGGQKIGELNKNEILGELSFIKEEEHQYSAMAGEDTIVLIIPKTNLDFVLGKSKKMKENFYNYLQSVKNGSNHHVIENGQKQEWVENTLEHIHGPSHHEIKEHSKSHSNAPLAIWLGILLDGIPESFVIGASLLLGKGISLSLLAGLFLSNFPEALSSSIGMRETNINKWKIIVMWTSIMLITGIGAYFGNIIFVSAKPSAFALIDGMAAGAMLTMIAETMLPEAFERGGTVTGLSTLAGFLSAILFKVLGT